MKKTAILIVMVSLVLINLNAQEIILTFTPADASDIIDSIKVINTVSGEKIEVSGAAQVDITSIATGIKTNGLGKKGLNVFPNPFSNQTRLQFFSEIEGQVNINLVTLEGRTVAQETLMTGQGLHTFNISVNSSGIYVLFINGNNFSYSTKLVVNGNETGINKIEYLGNTQNETLEKSAMVDEADIMHATLYSGEKITRISDAPQQSKSYVVDFNECKDKDGRIYPVVKIGDQYWMGENLAYLPGVNPVSEESYDDPMYYVFGYYENNVDDAKKLEKYKKYGVLYNWNAAMISCPDGWHLPTDAEWEQLAQYVSDENGEPGKSDSDWLVIGIYLKATSGWADKNDGSSGDGIDKYGFSGLPGGSHDSWISAGISGNWWSATKTYEGSFQSWFYYLFCTYDRLVQWGRSHYFGHSVRCIKD